MTLQLSSVNLWAMLVSVLSNMFIGALWYSPLLFGNQWLKLIGKRQEDISQSDANKSMIISLIPAILSVIFLTIILKLTNAVSVGDAIVVGSIVSVGFIGMSAWNLVLYEGRSVKLAILNLGYSFVSLNVAAVILTVWQ